MYQSRIGLEIHIRLNTLSKAFCPCPARYGDEANSNICPICLGYPGTLPLLNRRALEMAYLLARALNCRLSPVVCFDRKNYFYPDMPKNYQISQVRLPLGRDGRLEVEIGGQWKGLNIHQLHLEEDAGKMIHRQDATLVDYNRAGTPLVEIVTAPELETGQEAEQVLRGLRRIVRYLKVSDGNMEEGSLRCDANVSLHLPGEGLGQKVEIKNLNSSRFVRLALDHEIVRQREILQAGGPVAGETRLWNEAAGITEPMRSKDEGTDYRYLPESDLPPFFLEEGFFSVLKKSLVELPGPRKRRLIRDYGLSEEGADLLTEERGDADFFERVVELGADPDTAAAWLRSDVRRILNRENLSLEACPLSAERLAELLALLGKGKIGGRIAKKTLEEVFRQDRDPGDIVRERGWELIGDPEELRPVVEGVLAAHPQAAQELREGKDKPLEFLTGMVIRETAGRADPGLVKSLLREIL